MNVELYGLGINVYRSRIETINNSQFLDNRHVHVQDMDMS